jgi:hypothetical protein
VNLVIPEWKQLPKYLTTWVAIVVGVLAALETQWSALDDFLPPGWAMYATPIFLIARVINQTRPKEGT